MSPASGSKTGANSLRCALAASWRWASRENAMARWLAVVLLVFAVGQSFAARPMDKSGRIRAPTAPPTWPDSYEMEYFLILPYVQTLQPGGLRYPVHVWWDGPGQRYRFDVYNGLDSTGWDTPKGINWNLYPRIRDIACDFSNGTAGPTAAVLSHQQLLQSLGLQEGGSSTPLPDISDWEYAGTATVRNSEALVWQYSVRHGEKTAQYTFYTAQNGWPLKFYMMGLNLLTGSHFDEYVIEFTRFKPGPIPAAAFALSPVCQDAADRARQQPQLQPQPQQQRARQVGLAARLGALLPASQFGAGVATNSLSELRSQAASAFEANSRLVEEHNRKVRLAAGEGGNGASSSAPSYTLSLNHFAHLTHQQWAASMLGLAPRRSKEQSLAAAPSRLYQRVLRDDQLPQSVDWRGTGADGPGVKDQVSCGSCWAFSAVGAMQGAWFKATGQSLSFSEQQLVDCSWDYYNNGCAGGNVEPAIQYVVDGGGVAQEADYPYAAQNAFCRGPVVSPTSSLAAIRGKSADPSANDPPAPLTGRFSGFVNVPPRDEKALMEAVALHGPVAVVMNAARPPFKFYSEGVYYNPECKEDPDSMDHAIVLVGYGTSPEGVDYWLIKNSWSKYWGMDGYARVARRGNDCGITTDPVLALVDPSAAEEATGAAATMAAA